MRDSRLIICAVLSIGGHLALAKGLGRLPRHADSAMRIISLRVVSAPPPAPEPPPEPTATPQPPTPSPAVAHLRAHVRTPPTTQEIPRQERPPPPERPAALSDGAAGPIFGVSMESTSQAGSGPAMRIGRPTGGPVAGTGDDDDARGGRKGLAAPLPAYEVTTLPEPQGRCEGQYTEEALRAAIEGTVILDVIISETGHVRDVRVVSGLPHGLNEAAIAAVKRCRFSIGLKDGKPVPVRLPPYKIRFILPTDE
jgi:protein TonB